MIEVNERFEVAARPAEVYAVMSDPHAVVECVSGAALGAQEEDGSYLGTMTVKFSALRVSFSGRIMLTLDPDNLQGQVVATGRDKQGGTKFKATADFAVVPGDTEGTSLVTVIGEIDLAGKLASVIEGAAGTVVRRMSADFVAALSMRCASDSASLGPADPAASAVEPSPSASPDMPVAAATDDAAVASAQAPRVLVLHDFGGSPSGVRAWGEALAAAGVVVSIPRLPGHGTRWKDLDATAWPQWLAAAREALTALRDGATGSERVVVMGVSLGATLALRLAEEHPGEVAGVVAVNPVLTGLIGAKKLLGLRRLIRRSRPAVANDVRKSGARDVGYDRVPLAAAGSLIALGAVVRDGLATIDVPVLLALSAVDHVVDRADGEQVWSMLPTSGRSRIDLAESYHAAAVDNDADRLFAESTAFVTRVTSATATV